MNFTPAITFAPLNRPSTHRLVRVTTSWTPEHPCDPIKRIVADAFGVNISGMTSRLKSWHIAQPRMIAMALACEFTGLSLASIGQAFGGRDHGTVLHARNKVRDWASTEPKLAALIETLRERCGKGAS